jgi:hypothetical protein
LRCPSEVSRNAARAIRGRYEKRYFAAGFGLLLAATTSPAQAASDQRDARNMICASDPSTIVTTRQDAGYVEPPKKSFHVSDDRGYQSFVRWPVLD